MAKASREQLDEMKVAELYAHKLVRTIRVRLADKPGKLGEVACAIGSCNALIGDIRKIAIDSQSVLRTIGVHVDDLKHLDDLVGILDRIEGVTVEAVVDDVLALHEGGKLRVKPVAEVRSLLDLQKVYTPGVASVSRLIATDPEAYRRYTWVGNTVAIVTDGSAILGLGDLGTKPALPVMEGKAVLLDQLAGVSCVPILVSEREVDAIVATVKAISDGFGAIMLEDISAPRCFEIERRLREALPVPVFHDDQHGTAVVTLAALLNACRATGARLEDLAVCVSGAGAAGTAITKLLLSAGVTDIICCDRSGAIHKGREGLNAAKEELAEITNARGVAGSLAEVLAGRHAFIGVSSPGTVTQAMVKSMAEPRLVLALANPDPEILPADAVAAGASVAVDGRTVNNALAFPGIIRGALDSAAKAVTEPMKLAAARVIADCAPEGMIMPGALDRAVHEAVARAVAEAWTMHRA